VQLKRVFKQHILECLFLSQSTIERSFYFRPVLQEDDNDREILRGTSTKNYIRYNMLFTRISILKKRYG